ncbi:hypothetical protein THASP1DRAFT_28407 [Thamnocephalis sphaerospora]|uniref:G-protein coupled receptors family 1 profile domain-containing protein n=1 Tax=Thamnocephalis sphaerospora TaxID=78915 RepID=A0A4P9XU95_9FUNG|nr:hypothetical protein THASP1DRAFT_28407 [Thamnocephalis sphaerospora]|eukprot:RKP09788.1 hypothetical protein THASP1DRAFT_28407 [Thamnocephalis sphaerospora]
MSFFQGYVLLAAPEVAQNAMFVILLTLMLWTFLNNIYKGVGLLYARRYTRGTRLYVPILNTVPNLICCPTSAYVLLHCALPGSVNCDVNLAMDAAAVSLGTASIVAILFIRVYYAWMRHRWLLYLGAVLILATLVVGASSFFALSMHTDKNGFCLAKTNTYWTLAKFTTDIVTNLTLSGLYIYVLGRVVRGGLSVSLYKELRHEGLVATFMVIASSILAALVVLLDLLPDNALYIYAIDILINATLINQMLCRRRNSDNVRPRDEPHYVNATVE